MMGNGGVVAGRTVAGGAVTGGVTEKVING